MSIQDPKKQDPKPQEKSVLPPDLQKLYDDMVKSHLKMAEDILEDLEKLADPVTPPPPGTPTVGYPISLAQFLSSDAFKNLAEADKQEIQKYIAEKEPKLVFVRNDTEQPDRFYFSKDAYNTGRYIHIAIDDTYNTKTKWQQGLQGDDYTMVFKSQPIGIIDNEINLLNRRLAELDKNPVKKPVPVTKGLVEFAGPYTVSEFTKNKYVHRQFKNTPEAIQIKDDLLLDLLKSPVSDKDPTRIYTRYEPNSNFDWPLTGILVGRIDAEGKNVHIEQLIDVKSDVAAEMGINTGKFSVHSTSIVKDGGGTKITVPNEAGGLTKDGADKLYAQLQKIPSFSVNAEIHTHQGKASSIGPLNITAHPDRRPGELDDFMRTNLYRDLWKTPEGRKKIEAIYAQRDAGKYDHMMIIQNTDKSGEKETRIIFGKRLQSDTPVKHAITGEEMNVTQFGRAMNVESEEVRPMRPLNVQSTKTGAISPREAEDAVEIIRDAVNRRVISAAPEKNPLFDQLLAKGPSASSAGDVSVMAPVTPRVGDKKLSVA